jgi:hypothetical protein
MPTPSVDIIYIILYIPPAANSRTHRIPRKHPVTSLLRHAVSADQVQHDGGPYDWKPNKNLV